MDSLPTDRRGPSLSVLRAPSGTLSLAPFEFRELCFEMTEQDEIRTTFSQTGLSTSTSITTMV